MEEKSMTYIYPENLKAKPMLWLWEIKNFVIIGIGVLLSAVLLIYTRKLLPMAIVMAYAFLTIKLDGTTILEFIKYAGRYFISTQQEFRWR